MGWPLEAGNSPRFIASKKKLPLSYNYEELNSANDSNEQEMDPPLQAGSRQEHSLPTP